MTITLCMIVKNEENVIKRCLDSVIGLVDEVIIVDTGSTDKTKDIILSHILPVQLFERVWVNFGHNRNELLDLALSLGGDYLLLLDADQTVNFSSLPLLTADGYMLRYSGDLDYQQKLLVKNNFDYKYHGATHEYIHSSKEVVSMLCEEITVEHHADGGSRSDKFQRDLILLEKQIIETPDDPRTMFYLARTEEGLGNIPKAIKYFNARSKMDGTWEEERWVAQYSAAVLSGSKDGLLSCWESRPSRGEPLYQLCILSRNSGEYTKSYMYASTGLNLQYPKDDVLFIDKGVYNWGFDLELSLAEFYLGYYELFKQRSKKILSNNTIPQYIRERVVENLTFVKK